jgi:REP-associated tyrosine transposase
MGRLTHRTLPGWTYFVTTKCRQSVAVFQVHENPDLLIAKLLEYRDKGNYLLHDFVLMPNHLHLILTPSRSTSLEKGMQLIKGGSSHAIHSTRGSHQQIWQSGFHESRVKDSGDYKIKADYIRFNPVTAKLVQKPEDWCFGSANRSFVMDLIPQGLKPLSFNSAVVGAEAPTPKPFTAHRSASVAKP